MTGQTLDQHIKLNVHTWHKFVNKDADKTINFLLDFYSYYYWSMSSLFDVLVQDYSFLEIFLSKFIKDHISKIKVDNLEGFSSDSEFFTLYECYFAIEYKLWKFSEECEKVSTSESAKNFSTISKGLRHAKKYVQTVIDKRIEIMKKNEKCLLPRILRVSEKYQLTPKEIECFIYLVVCHSGTYLASIDIDNICSFKSLGNYCDANPKEILNFTSSHRQHVKVRSIRANF